jgi:hypothetical protein
MLPAECPCCGLDYDRFRTGLSFAEIVGMLWVDSPDPRDWRYKRRNTVLGFWRQLKLEMWAEHLASCQPIPRDARLNASPIPW